MESNVAMGGLEIKSRKTEGKKTGKGLGAMEQGQQLE